MKLLTKRILSVALTFCLCLTMLPAITMYVDALTPNYSVSSSYKASSYYSALCKVTLTGNQREDIVNVALSQVGYKEGSSSNDYSGADDGSYNNYTEYNYWYNKYVSSGMPVGGSGAPWCATFVSWCAEQANIPSSILKRSTAAGHGASYFNIKFYSGSSTLASSNDNDSYFMGYNYTPKMGDLFFTRSWSHVGLVVAVNGSYVTTVEGNTNNNGSSQGNGVYRLTSRKISDLYFGVPNYSGTHTHNYVEGSEAAHPHRVYMKCSCGSYYYTGKTVYLENKNCCNKASSGWTFTDYDVPSISNLSYGSDYNIKGTITSNIRINWIGIVIYDCKDNEIAQANAYPGSTSYNISGLNDQINFAKLPVGKYKLLVHANNPNNDYTILYSEYFNVGAPKLAAPNVSVRTTSDGKAIFSWPAVANADRYDVRISNSNKESYKDIWSISKTSYEIDLPDGNYYVWVGAVNSEFYYCFTYGSVIGFTVKKTIPGRPELINLDSEYNENDTIKFEWDSTERTTHYNLYLKKLNVSTNQYEVYDYEMHYIESGYERRLPAGKYAVQLQSTNSEDWSYTDGDWVYFTVNSVYTISYNANGGIGAPEDQIKYYNTALTLSRKIPTKSGYTFLGWSTSSSAASASYQPGDSFTPNSNTILYAVWKKGCENNSHKYNYKESKAPTFSATGTLTGTCSNCSDTITVTLPKLNIIDYTHTVIKAATCTTAGIERYTWKTTAYGNFYFDVSLPSTEHTYINRITAPTCTSQGYTSHTCSCGYSYVDTYTNALDHDYIDAVTPSTSNEQGYTTHTCSRCGDTYIDSYTDPIATYILGDVNGDGKVNGDDVSDLSRYVAGWPSAALESALAADVNGDGKINGDDVSDLSRFVAGWPGGSIG